VLPRRFSLRDTLSPQSGGREGNNMLSVSEEYLPEMRKSHPESEWERKSDMAGKEQLIA
jgi:hypothetical protein